MPGSLPGGDRHIVLVGHPGPRRTAIGRRLASLLGRPFVDTDEQLELDAGRTLSRLALEHGRDDLRRREAQILAHLLARDVPLVVLAPGAVEVGPGCVARLARSAVVLWPRGKEARAWPNRLADHYQDIADHVVDLEPFHTTEDQPERAIARHILQLLVTGDLRGSIHVPDRVLALADGLLGDDVTEPITWVVDGLPAHVADIVDHIIDVERVHADDEPERAIARHIARLLAADDPRPGTGD